MLKLLNQANILAVTLKFMIIDNLPFPYKIGERGGSVVECRTPELEVGGSKPTAAVLCPWARHFTPRKYWLITQEAVAPSRHDWKIVDWDVKPQHKQTKPYKIPVQNVFWQKIVICYPNFKHFAAHFTTNLLLNIGKKVFFTVSYIKQNTPRELSEPSFNKLRYGFNSSAKYKQMCYL